jgi:hypothetical protein
MSDPLAGLTRELGASPPAAIAALDPADLEALREALTAAREAQRVALEAATDSGLGIVPRLLRGTVKKALFG